MEQTKETSGQPAPKTKETSGQHLHHHDNQWAGPRQVIYHNQHLQDHDSSLLATINSTMSKITRSEYNSILVKTNLVDFLLLNCIFIKRFIKVAVPQDFWAFISLHESNPSGPLLKDKYGFAARFVIAEIHISEIMTPSWLTLGGVRQLNCGNPKFTKTSQSWTLRWQTRHEVRLHSTDYNTVRSLTPRRLTLKENNKLFKNLWELLQQGPAFLVSFFNRRACQNVEFKLQQSHFSQGTWWVRFMKQKNVKNFVIQPP